MDDEAEEGQNTSAAFPDPPPFYRYFTADNLERLEAAQAQAEPLNELPSELKHLIPPQPPESGEYTLFGQSFKIEEKLPSLKEQGVEQVYHDIAIAQSSADGVSQGRASTLPYQLKKLVRSILLSFHELVAILSTNPEEYGSKIDDLNTLFYNIHHLLNEYRPHQARETLIDMMEAQMRQKRAEIEGVRGMQEKIDKLLTNLTNQQDGMDVDEQPSPSEGGASDKEAKRIEDRRVWSVLDSIEA